MSICRHKLLHKTIFTILFLFAVTLTFDLLTSDFYSSYSCERSYLYQSLKFTWLSDFEYVEGTWHTDGQCMA